MDDSDLDSVPTVEQLIDANYERLRRIVYARVWDPQLADDLTNEAVCITLKHVRAGRLVVSDEIPGYILGIVTNLLRNHWRDKDNRPDVRVDAETLAEVVQPERDESFDLDRIKQLVRMVIASLKSSRDRLIVVRYYLEEDDKQVICADLGITALQFDKLLFRVRQRMHVLVTALGMSKEEFLGVLLWIAAGVLAQLFIGSP
jgi:RNA polymerase sigma-70 factor (ECF subfamily)